jgi:hypothetical protein
VAGTLRQVARRTGTVEIPPRRASRRSGVGGRYRAAGVAAYRDRVDGNLLMGFLKVLAISLAPVVIFGAVLHARTFGSGVRRLLMRVHLWRRPPVVPTGPPLERLAADLRRLYPVAHHPGPGVRMPKQRGVLMAYDQRLVEAARALDVDTTLAELPAEGFDRDAERLRLEYALSSAGLVWQAREDWPHDPAA